MTTLIMPVLTADDDDAAASIRTEVFEQEMSISIPPPTTAAGGRRFDVLARAESGEPAGTLSVVETTGEIALHRLYGLAFSPDATTARYAQLAVRRKFRGGHLPARLILKAHECFVEPENFDFSWLLFPAARTATSFLCQCLGFRPELSAVSTEYGRCRALVRSEKAAASRQALMESIRHLADVTPTRFPLAPQIISGEMRA